MIFTSGTLVMVSCGGKDDKEHDQDDIDDITLAENSPFQFASYTEGDSARSFGKKITAEGAVNVHNLAANPAKANGFTGKITGKRFLHS